MRLKAFLKTIIVTCLTLVLLVLPLFNVFISTNNSEARPIQLPIETVSTPLPQAAEPAGFDAIYDAVGTYLNSGSAWNISAADLFMLLNDEDESNDPFIISVRKPEDYAKGHIPGAVNIAFGDIAKQGTINALPRDRQIVVYCYTGHSGSQATAMLGALGFNVLNLLHGMSSWSKDTEVAPNRFTPESRQDYAFETSPNEATETYPFPTTNKTVREAAEAYAKPKNIKAADLFMLLNDDDEDNDPFIVSVRKPEDYTKGHIPGAVNIGFTALAQEENLSKIPSDRPVIVYCYTGHTGSQATALLNILGYDATNLLFGMCSWTQDPEVAPKCFDNETQSMDYEFELTPNAFVPVEMPCTEPAGFDAIYDAVGSYLNSGSAWNISAADLFMLLNDEDETNDPFIISVRKPEDYAKGHIPGAVNIAFGDIAKRGTINALPRDRQIVVYCYTGHSGSQATAMLGALGFNVLNLLHGMSSWTKDTEVAPNRFTPESRQDYAFETDPNEATETYPFPTTNKTVREAAEAYAKPKNIKAADLFMLLNDDDEDNDPFIVSVRKPEDYAKGHIPGAVNIGFTALAQEENLAKIPSDRPVIVYCYTGHTGSQATALLNILGYDATNLLFGMCSWTQDTEVAPKCFDNETQSMDYEFELTPNVFVPIEEPGMEPAGFDAIYDAVNRYLNTGSTWNIKAEDLFLLLNDDHTDNDPFIISVRKPEDYAKGHIPGAVNIPFSDITRNCTIDALPRDRLIVVYCYTGHSGSQATAMLGTLGFNALNLLHGMSSWTKDTEVAPNRFTPESRQNYEFETTPNESGGPYPYPVTDKTVREAAQAYTSPKNIKAADLFMLLNDNDESNDPFIISVRKPEDYARGHVPGAVNISCATWTTKENLSAIPSDRPVVTYCYTGHSGSQAAALLNLMGYDASNLLFGMCSWTQDAKVAPLCFDNDTQCMDYKFELTPNVFVPAEETISEPGKEPQPPPDLQAILEGNTCVACHSNETLLQQTADPVVEEPEPEEASGEG
jgi:rhodanese-related sulfurtransferase